MNLKMRGDAILAFFPVKLDDIYLPCIDAVNCAYSMIKIMRESLNPILNEYDYPEMGVRIGIDVGENIVVQYGWSNRTYTTMKSKQKIFKKPHLDVLGYTNSIAAKMTAFAKPNQIIIGQSVYDVLDNMQKSNFRDLPVNTDVWSYVSSITGEVYNLYGSSVKKEKD
jgi:adenylate cyclase